MGEEHLKVRAHLLMMGFADRTILVPSMYIVATDIHCFGKMVPPNGKPSRFEVRVMFNDRQSFTLRVWQNTAVHARYIYSEGFGTNSTRLLTRVYRILKRRRPEL